MKHICDNDTSGFLIEIQSYNDGAIPMWAA